MTGRKMYLFEPITGQEDDPDERPNKLGITRGETLKAWEEDSDPDAEPPRWAADIIRRRKREQANRRNRRD